MPLLRFAVLRSLRLILLWSLVLAAVMTLYSAFWPTLGDTDMFANMLDQLPQGMVDAFGFGGMTSGGGFVNASFFGVLGYFIGAAAVISWGAEAIGSDEETGELELTLAHRVSRSQVIVERGAALLVRTVIACFIVALAFTINTSLFGLGVTASGIIAQVLSYCALLILFGMVAFSAGAMTGRRSPAVGAGAGLVVWSFLAKALAALNESWVWLHRLSPFSWAYRNEPYAHGVDITGIALLLGFAILAALGGWLVFLRRDIMT